MTIFLLRCLLDTLRFINRHIPEREPTEEERQTWAKWNLVTDPPETSGFGDGE